MYIRIKKIEKKKRCPGEATSTVIQRKVFSFLGKRREFCHLLGFVSYLVSTGVNHEYYGVLLYDAGGCQEGDESPTQVSHRGENSCTQYFMSIPMLRKLARFKANWKW